MRRRGALAGRTSRASARRWCTWCARPATCPSCRLSNGDRSLDFSRFDVGGVANARNAGQLGAYLFSDRGIYRPGDEIHVGMIVKAADWGKDGTASLAGLPLETEVTDARGLVVRREKIKLAAGGFEEVRTRHAGHLAHRRLHVSISTS